jgi:glycosyltransferase XagB
MASTPDEMLAFCLAHEAAPRRGIEGRLAILCAAPEHSDAVAALFGSGVEIVWSTRQAVYDAIADFFSARLLDDATFGLERAEPQFSARTVITRAQCILLSLICAAGVTGMLLWPAHTVFAAAVVLGFWFALNAVFRAWLVWLGADSAMQEKPLAVADENLPLYSILVPLRREAKVVPRLLQALTALDYPGLLAHAPQT